MSETRETSTGFDSNCKCGFCTSSCMCWCVISFFPVIKFWNMKLFHKLHGKKLKVLRRNTVGFSTLNYFVQFLCCVGVERDNSRIKIVKRPRRSTMTQENLNLCLRTSINGPSLTDFDALECRKAWVGMKKRRGLGLQ